MPYGPQDRKYMMEPSLDVLRLGMRGIQHYTRAHSVSSVNLSLLQHLLHRNRSLAQFIYSSFSNAFTLQQNAGELIEVLMHARLVSNVEARQMRERFRAAMNQPGSDHGWRFLDGPWKFDSKRAYTSLMKDDYWSEHAMVPMSVYHALCKIDFTDESLYTESGTARLIHLYTMIEGLLENYLNLTRHRLDHAVYVDSANWRLARLVEHGHLSAADAFVVDALTNPSANKYCRYVGTGTLVEPKILIHEVFEALESNAQRGFALHVIARFITGYNRTVSVDFAELAALIRSGMEEGTPMSLLHPIIAEPTGIPYELDRPWGKATLTSHWQELSVNAAQRQEQLEAVYSFSWG